MKRSVMLVIMVLALAAACVFCYMPDKASAADFTGKWIGYKMVVKQGDQSSEMNYEELMGEEFDEEEMGYVEFKDEKATIVMQPDDDPEERTVKASGDKLIVDTTEDDNEGIKSAEFIIENGELIFSIVTDDGTMNLYFRRPKN